MPMSTTQETGKDRNPQPFQPLQTIPIFRAPFRIWSKAVRSQATLSGLTSRPDREATRSAVDAAHKIGNSSPMARAVRLWPEERRPRELPGAVLQAGPGVILGTGSEGKS